MGNSLRRAVRSAALIILLLAFLLLAGCRGGTEVRLFEIGNENFDFLGYEIAEDGASVRIRLLCRNSFSSLETNLTFLDASGSPIGELRDSVAVAYSSALGEPLTFTLTADPAVLRNTAKIDAAFTATSTVDPALTVAHPNVTFISEDEIWKSESYVYRSSVPEPGQAPEKEDWVFVGWSLIRDGWQPYDFTSPLLSDISLYAYYRMGESALAEIEQASVGVRAVFYGENGEELISEGSGVIFYQNPNSKNYYLLTNNHVVALPAGYVRADYTVTDLYGNTYAAKLYPQITSSESQPAYEKRLATYQAAAPEYDVGVLFFAPGDHVLSVMTTGVQNAPDVNDTLHCVGFESVEGQFILRRSDGKITRYTTVEPGDDPRSQIAFDVIEHTAPIGHGWSGGVAYMDDGVVGLSFGFDESAGLSYVIPLNYINRFLNLYVWS